MKEEILHYIWKTRNFDHRNLLTTRGERVEVLDPGKHNHDAGPDFLNASICIDGVSWEGAAEIHIRGSEWHVHKHHHDPNYDQVILHVVWADDQEIRRRNGSRIPTVELRDRINRGLVENASIFLDSIRIIPCQELLKKVSHACRAKALEISLDKRLSFRANRIINMLGDADYDWNEVAFRMIAGAFGFKVNRHPFLLLSRKVPYALVRRQTGSLTCIQALLFGGAGFLDQDCRDSFFKELKNEFEYLRRKYRVRGNHLNLFSWRFSRTRPQNFPTFRLAQFSSFLTKRNSLFAEILSLKSLRAGIDFFEAEPDQYWKDHYQFDKRWKRPVSGNLGVTSIHNLLINTVIPLQYAFSKYIDNSCHGEQALALLRQIPAEKNRIIHNWQKAGLEPEHAGDSQALITLFQDFCEEKQCLNCSIGADLIRNQ